MKSVEKIRKCFVLCGIDNAGTTVYLKSLGEVGKWLITADIEMASKCANRSAANLMKDFYDQEMGDADWVAVPVEIEYRLVNES